MEVERALADLEEVRDRLASVQRYRGYSGPAAAVSGVVAVVAGFVQLAVVPWPHGGSEIERYLSIWLSCLALALAINYGAGYLWYVRNAGRQERRQSRMAGFTILPAVVLGAVLSLALVLHGAPGLLPGVWYACYGIGLFAARTMLPHGASFASAAFGLAGAALLLSPDLVLPLSWWVMPLGFGLGQMWIGWLITKEERQENLEAV